MLKRLGKWLNSKEKKLKKPKNLGPNDKPINKLGEKEILKLI